jgi:hypothetical protein
VYAVSETPTTFRTKNAARTGSGMVAAPSASAGSAMPEATLSATKAANHGIEPPGLKKKSVPMTGTSAHRLTALDATYPPSVHWSRNGRIVMRLAWVTRKNP